MGKFQKNQVFRKIFFRQRKTIKKESSLPKRAKGVMARFPVIFYTTSSWVIS
jgi:hypothetical protein